MPDLTTRLLEMEGDVMGSLSMALQDYMRVPQGPRVLALQFACPNLQIIKSPAVANRGIEDITGKKEAREKAEILLGTPLKQLKDDDDDESEDKSEENLSQFDVRRLECQSNSPVAVFVDCFCGKNY